MECNDDVPRVLTAQQWRGLNNALDRRGSRVRARARLEGKVYTAADVDVVHADMALDFDTAVRNLRKSRQGWQAHAGCWCLAGVR